MESDTVLDDCDFLLELAEEAAVDKALVPTVRPTHIAARSLSFPQHAPSLNQGKFLLFPVLNTRPVAAMDLQSAGLTAAAVFKEQTRLGTKQYTSHLLWSRYLCIVLAFQWLNPLKRRKHTARPTRACKFEHVHTSTRAHARTYKWAHI